MKRICLMLARFSISAWVGAAVLFVVNTIFSARSPLFDSVDKANLAAIRFPIFYFFGFALVGLTLVSTSLIANHWLGARWRIRVALFLLAVALLTMIVDYVWVLQPLLEIVGNAEAARPASFQTYHNANMYLNSGQLLCCLLAALLICWPGPHALDLGEQVEEA